MSLFNKKEPIQEQPSMGKPANDVITSIISKDMRVKGEVIFQGKARVDGIVEGNIKGEHLVLSESGKVMGDLELSTLICHGAIEGNVKAQQVTAHSNSSLQGNLVAASLTVESGAKLNGEVSSSTQPQAKVQPTAAPKPAPPEKKEESKG